MATLDLTTEEFSDIAIIWLFDQLINPEQIENKDLSEFIKKHGSKIRTPLTKYYLDSGSEARFKYKRIKGVFDGSDNSIQHIKISPSQEEIEKEKKKEGIVKKVIKKILKKENLSLEDLNVLKEETWENWQETGIKIVQKED